MINSRAQQTVQTTLIRLQLELALYECLFVTVLVCVCVCCTLGLRRVCSNNRAATLTATFPLGLEANYMPRGTCDAAASAPWHPWTMARVSDGCWGLARAVILCVSCNLYRDRQTDRQIGRQTEGRGRRRSNLCNAKHIPQSHDLLQIVITCVSEHVCTCVRMCVRMSNARVHAINAISIYICICITLALALKSTAASESVLSAWAAWMNFNFVFAAQLFV